MILMRRAHHFYVHSNNREKGMLESFKNLELLRFYLSSKYEDCTSNNEKQRILRTEQTMSTVFSSLFSLVVTVALAPLNSVIPIGGFIPLVIGVYLVGFVVSYFSFLFVYRWLHKLHKRTKAHKSACTLIEAKKKIDEFDHIACDNVLIAYEFQGAYSTESNLEKKMFYFCEVLYYLNKSLIKIRNVLFCSDLCINNRDKADGLESYRIANLLKMIKEIFNGFIKIEQGKIYIDKKYCSNINKNIDSVGAEILELEKKLINL